MLDNKHLTTTFCTEQEINITYPRLNLSALKNIYECNADEWKFLELTINKHVPKKKRKDLALVDSGDSYNPTEEPNPDPIYPRWEFGPPKTSSRLFP